MKGEGFSILDFENFGPSKPGLKQRTRLQFTKKFTKFLKSQISQEFLHPDSLDVSTGYTLFLVKKSIFLVITFSYIFRRKLEKP